MKVAQLTATIPDILPPEYIKEFSELQSNAPSMGPLFVKRRMNNELGKNWEKYFLKSKLRIFIQMSQFSYQTSLVTICL